MCNPRNSQVGKGGLPPLHLDSLKLAGERGQAALPDLRVYDDWRTEPNSSCQTRNPKMAKLQRDPECGCIYSPRLPYSASLGTTADCISTTKGLYFFNIETDIELRPKAGEVSTSELHPTSGCYRAGSCY